ncbi:MAG: ferritin [Chloroflexi bacterium RBG_19FT_COMBO_56_12]|nr:MAG: ferritin [Chloroflexi bacterium RBG_19FT_COMBO_56_12]
MLSNNMLNEVNDQIKHEIFSAYLYLSMSAHFEASNLPGFAKWMRIQAQEEMGHAMKFFDFLVDRGGKITLEAIAQPPVDFGTPQAIFEQVLEHEQFVTARINTLYALAVKENDFASQVFLNWFVTEQVEEEKNASIILETLKMIGDRSTAIYQLDRHVGKRGED